ncbi:MAG: hypothetical protein LZ173_01225 [Thaumarchaeota archaeon]|jgi:uncharacterized membrane-anchored protein YjiN (DUF445 family)|nr:hypothetical protein [Candidatus Geocrenenecus arthurdayi]
MSGESLEEIITRKINEVFQEDKIQSIIRHEVEERIADMFWKLEMYIKNTLAEKVKEVIENKKFEELIESGLREFITPERIQEHINRKVNARYIEEEALKMARDVAEDTVKKLVSNTLKDEVVKTVIETARDVARRYTGEAINKIIEQNIGLEIKFIIGSIEEIRKTQSLIISELQMIQQRLQMPTMRG